MPPTRAGLFAFTSPQQQAMGVGQDEIPLVPFGQPGQRAGLQQISPAPFAPTDDVAPASPLGARQQAGVALQEALAAQQAVFESTAPPPAAPSGPRAYFSPSTGRLHVGNFTFYQNNASDALRAYELLRTLQTDVPPPQDAEDWRPLPRQEFEGFINDIANPSGGRLFAEGFQRGMRGLGTLAGAGMQFVGMEERGRALIDEIAAGYERDAPYQRNFTEIDDVPDFGEWVASGLGEAAPSIIEGILAVAAGGLAGSAAAPGAGTIGGAALGIVGRQELRRRILRGVATHNVLPAEIRRQSRDSIRDHLVNVGRVVPSTAEDLADDIILMRRTGAITGAVVASTANNFGIGTADVYNELREVGAGPEDADARIAALAGAIPYTALETIPDLLFTGTITGVLRGPANLLGGPVRRTAAFGAGGVAGESLAEGGQEAIVSGIGAGYSGQDWLTPENIERIQNAAAIGGLAGGVLGAAAGVGYRGEPATDASSAPNVQPPPTWMPPMLPAPTPPTPPAAPEWVIPAGNLEGPPQYPQITRGEHLAPAGTIYPEPPPPPPPGQQRLTAKQQTQRAIRDTAEDQGLPVQRRTLRRGLGRSDQAVYDAFRAKQRRDREAVDITSPEYQTLVSEFHSRIREDAPLRTAHTVDTGDRFYIEPATPGQTYDLGWQQVTGQDGDIVVTNADTGAYHSVVELKQFRKTYEEAGGNLWRAKVGREIQYFDAPYDMDIPTREGWNFDVKKGQAVIKDDLGQYVPSPETWAKKYKAGPAPKSAPSPVKLRRGGTKPRPVEAPTPPRVAQAAQRAEEAAKKPAPPPPKPKVRTAEEFVDEARAKVKSGKAKSLRAALTYLNLRKKNASPEQRAEIERAQQMARDITDEETADALREREAEKVPPRTPPRDSREMGARGEARKEKAKEEAEKQEELAEERAKKESGEEDLKKFREILARLNSKAVQLKPQEYEKAKAEASKFISTHGRTFQAWMQEDGREAVDFTEAEQEAIRIARSYDPKARGRFMRATPKSERAVEHADLLSALSKFAVQADLYMGPEGHRLPPAWRQELISLYNKEHTGLLKIRNTQQLGKRILALITAYDNNELTDLTDMQIARIELLREATGRKEPKGPPRGPYKKGKLRRSTDARLGVREDGLSAAALNGIWKRTYEWLTKGYKGLAGLRVHVVDSATELVLKAPALASQAADFSQFSIDATHDAVGRYIVESKKLPAMVHSALMRGTVNEAARVGRKKFFATLSNSAGYAFTDDTGTHHIILIANNIYSVKDAIFVILHELIGHVGVQGMFTERQLAQFADEIKLLPNIQKRVRKWERDYPGEMDTIELVEEALADELADIESSFSRRVIAAVKNFIEDLAAAIGIKFAFKDSVIREILRNSKAYVRGQTDRRPIQGVAAKPPLPGRFSRERKTPEQRRTEAEKKKAKRAAAQAALEELARHTTQDVGFKPPSAWEQMRRIARDPKVGKSKLRRAFSAVANELEAMSNKAKRSAGIDKLLSLARMTADHSRALMGLFRDLRPLTLRAGELGWVWKLMNKKYRDPETGEVKELKGATWGELRKAAAMIANSTLYTRPKITEEMLHDPKQIADLIFTDPATGKIELDFAAFQAMWQNALVTPEQFRAGITPMTANGKAPWGEPFKADVTADSVEYKVYVENMHALARAQMEVLRSKVNEINGVLEFTLDELAMDMSNSVKTLRDTPTRERFIAWTTDIMKFYMEMTFQNWDKLNAKERTAQRQKAHDFLAKVLQALHNDQTILDWTDMTREFDPEKMNEKDKIAFDLRTDPKYKPIIDAMPEMRKIGMTKDQQISMLHVFNDAVLSNTSIQQAHRFAKASIAGGYAPIYRKGKYQVRIVPRLINPDGTTGEVAENVHKDALAALPYSRWDTLEDAQEVAGLYDAAFENQDLTVFDDKLEPVKIRLQAEYSSAPQTGTLVEEIDYNAFVRLLGDLGIDPNQALRKKIANNLAKVEERRRAALKRAGQPGFGSDTIGHVNEFLTTMAHYASRLRLRRAYNLIMRNKKNWLGDESHLRRLQEKFDQAEKSGNPAAIRLAEDDLLRYAKQFSHMSPIEEKAGGKTFKIRTSKGEQEMDRLGEGAILEEEAKRWLTWLEAAAETASLEHNDQDILSKAKWPRALAVMLQLGGNAASALVNATSPWIFTLEYLATRNAKTGRGGGFGEATVFAELVKAYGNILNPVMADRLFLKELRRKGNWAEYGLTKDELLMLETETENGVLQASQQLSFTGGEIQGLGHVALDNAAQGWMAMFTHAEMLNRRITALVAYRLYKERMLSAGADPKAFEDHNSAEYKRLIDYVEETIYDTQGDYALYNNPHIFRDTWMAYLLMYKKFPVFMTLMMYHLPTSAQIKMLALLLVVAGMKGLPFADDLMDLIDGLMQKFGIKRASVEAEMARFADFVMPGSSPYVLRGVLDQWLGGTWSTRMGFGDLIPFTGVLREGVSLERELEGLLGPVYAANKAALEYAGLLTAFGAQTVGLRDRTLSGADLIRRAPAAGIRTLEGFLYMQDGAVTDRDGRVVTEDPGFAAIASRFLGFYPAQATRMNDVVRLSRYEDNYIRVIKLRYVLRWANAFRVGDTQAMRQVERDVREYNASMRRAGRPNWMINNFRDAALRSGEATRENVVNRSANAASRNNPIAQISRIMGEPSGER